MATFAALFSQPTLTLLVFLPTLAVVPLLLFPDRAQEAEPVQPGHHHVGQDQVRAPFPGRRQRRLAVRHDRDPERAGEQLGDVLSHVGVVVGQEYEGAVVGPVRLGGSVRG